MVTKSAIIGEGVTRRLDMDVVVEALEATKVEFRQYGAIGETILPPHGAKFRVASEQRLIDAAQSVGCRIMRVADFGTAAGMNLRHLEVGDGFTVAMPQRSL